MYFQDTDYVMSGSNITHQDNYFHNSGRSMKAKKMIQPAAQWRWQHLISTPSILLRYHRAERELPQRLDRALSDAILGHFSRIGMGIAIIEGYYGKRNCHWFGMRRLDGSTVHGTGKSQSLVAHGNAARRIADHDQHR